MPGREANFVVFNPDGEFCVTADRLHYRHTISPYLNETLRGSVIATYLRGEPVFSEAGFAETPLGREITL